MKPRRLIAIFLAILLLFLSATTVSAGDIDEDEPTVIDHGTTENGRSYRYLIIDTAEPVEILNPMINIDNAAGEPLGDDITYAVTVKGGANATISRASSSSISTHNKNTGGIQTCGNHTQLRLNYIDLSTTGENSPGIYASTRSSIMAENNLVQTKGKKSDALIVAPISFFNDYSGAYYSFGLGSAAARISGTAQFESSSLYSEYDSPLYVYSGFANFRNTDLYGRKGIYIDKGASQSSVSLINSSLITDDPVAFRVSDTSASINLSGTTIETGGKNTAHVLLSAENSRVTLNTGVGETNTLKGDILTDRSSSAEVYLSCDYRGRAAGTGITISLTNNNKWTLTGNSVIDTFYGNKHNIDLNGHTLTIGGVTYHNADDIPDPQPTEPVTEPVEPTSAPTVTPTDRPTAPPTAPPTDAPTEEPTSQPWVPTAAPTEPQQPQRRRVIRGDADLDGNVTIIDATVIQKYLAGLKPLTPLQLVASNCDGDRSVSITDVTMIQRHLAFMRYDGRVGQFAFGEAE